MLALLGVAGAADTSEDVLAAFDTDGDGLISREEFRRAVREELAYEDPDFAKWFYELFDRADLDGNGSLDEAETKHLMELLWPSTLVEDGEEVHVSPGGAEDFRLLDVDADGKVDIFELEVVVEDFIGGDLDEAARGDLRLLFETCDINEDGYLDEREVVLMRAVADEVAVTFEVAAEQPTPPPGAEQPTPPPGKGAWGVLPPSRQQG